MGLEFLRSHGASRTNQDSYQSMLMTDTWDANPTPDEEVQLSIEQPNLDWQPLDVLSANMERDWPLRPQRFVDGKDVGRTVAWLRSAEGYPVPVRLSQIGAIVMREVNGELRRETVVSERVVSMMGDLFAWDEVEGFARALQANGFRLLLCNPPDGGATHLFEPMRKATQNRSGDEMVWLEKQVFSQDRVTPTILDGQLAPRASIPIDAASPIIGVIKTHSKNYLHPHGWQVFYDLEPGQRTPAFRLENPKKGLTVVSWYLRLDGKGGEMPDGGVVRLEMPEEFFTLTLGGDWSYLNQVSKLVYGYRCRDEGYDRRSVSLHPIQRAEESLGALFTQSEMLISHFYRMTEI